MKRYLLLLLGLIACSVQTRPPPISEPSDPPLDPVVRRSFTLSTDAKGNSLDPGSEVGGIPILVAREPAFEGSVSFELFGAPGGIEGRFDPPSTTGDMSALTLQVSQTTPSGDYDLSVRGTSGDESGTVQIPLFVTEGASNDRPGFGVALSPSSLQLAAGETETVRVRFNRSGGVEGPIGLSVSGEPEGVSVTIDTASQTPTLRVTADERAASGSYALTVRGRSGDFSSSTQLGLSVASEGAAGTARVRGHVRTANAEIEIGTLEARASNAPSATPAAEARPTFVPGQVLVQYRTGELSTQGSAQQLAQLRAALHERHGLKLLGAGSGAQPDLLAVTGARSVEAAVKALERDPSVRHAEPNYYLYTAALPNDPQLDKQWALSAAGLPVAWQAAQGGAEVVIALLDSGFDLSHEDLQGRFLPGYDFCALPSGNCSNAPTDADPSYGDPINSHGTLVAGIAGAAGNNGRGVAGVAHSDNIKLLPIKLFNDQGTLATAQGFIQSIRWAAGLPVAGVPTNRNPAQVINLSIGGDFSSLMVQSAIDEARGRGAVVVAATGNLGRAGIFSPAAAEGVVGVGSVGRDFRRSCFSNYGVGGSNGPGVVDIVAPGGEAAVAGCDNGNYGLVSTTLNSRYETTIGTSFATPMVAGAAALILSQEPDLSVSQVEERLYRGAYFDATMNADEVGRGVLRVERSLGFAGPGDQVRVIASGESVTDGNLATATLDLYGGSSAYSLEDLVPGRYRLQASADGLRGEASLTLEEGERREGVTVDLR